MDAKSTFLNGYIMEEVYVKRPPGFENEKFSDHVYKLSKALYGLKQALKAWYDRLKKQTQLYLLSIRTKIYLLFKFMLMILFLVLLMSYCVKIFLHV